MNPSPLFERHLSCPVCESKFTSMSVRTSAVNVSKVESDRHIIYRGPSPLHYIIAVCPICKYAAPYAKFKEPLSDHKLEKFISAQRVFSNLPDFGQTRDLGLSLLSFNLAVETAQVISLPASEIAGLVLSMAWIARESGLQPIEQRCLNQAMSLYMEAYTSEGEGKLSDVQLAYIIGEIHRRLGLFREAIVWLNQALNSKNIKKYPQIEREARDVWAAIREQG